MTPRIAGREPALFFTLAAAILGALASFGLSLSAEQTAAIMALLSAVASFIVRSKVSPVVSDDTNRVIGF